MDVGRKPKTYSNFPNTSSTIRRLSSIEKSQMASSLDANSARNWAHWVPRKVRPISSPYVAWSCFVQRLAYDLAP